MKSNEGVGATETNNNEEETDHKMAEGGWTSTNVGCTGVLMVVIIVVVVGAGVKVVI